MEARGLGVGVGGELGEKYLLSHPISSHSRGVTGHWNFLFLLSGRGSGRGSKGCVYGA